MQPAANPKCGSVEYAGSGQADVLLASDLPLHGAATQVVDAIRLALRQHAWRAGGFRVGYISCDHYLETEGRWSIEQALANADFLSQQPHVVGMLGPFNSAVTASVLPGLNRAGLAVVSPSNTYAPLTTRAPSFEPDEPARYAPTGKPSFVRLFPSDLHQSAALVDLLLQSGSRAPVVLHDDHPYGLAIAEGIRRAASAAELSLAGLLAWDNEASRFASLMRAIAARGPDALVVCGLGTNAVRHLLREKVAVLGPHAGPVRTFGADAWLQAWLFEDIAEAADDLTLVSPGLRPGMFPRRGEAFVDAFQQMFGVEREHLEPYAVHAAQCVDVLLQAIASSDGSRSGVRDKLFSLRMTDGVLGDFAIAASGEPVAAAAPISGFTVYRVRYPTGAEVVGPLLPRADLISAAFG